MQLLEVVNPLVHVNECRKSEGSKVANGDFVGSGVLDDFGAKVARLDRTEMLLVRLRIGSILVQHVWGTGLGLRLEYGKPELLGLNRLATFPGVLVALIQPLELLGMDIGETGALRGTHEGPIAVRLDSLHKKIGDPERVEEVSSTDFLLSVVLPQVKEVKHIGVPWFEVDGEGTRALVATLIDISGSRIVSSKHRNDTVRIAVGAGDVRSLGTDVVDVKTDTTGSLGDLRASLEGLIDTLDRVITHGDQEARGHLCMWCTGIEKLDVSGVIAAELTVGDAWVK